MVGEVYFLFSSLAEHQDFFRQASAVDLVFRQVDQWMPFRFPLDKWPTTAATTSLRATGQASDAGTLVTGRQATVNKAAQYMSALLPAGRLPAVSIPRDSNWGLGSPDLAAWLHSLVGKLTK